MKCMKAQRERESERRARVGGLQDLDQSHSNQIGSIWKVCVISYPNAHGLATPAASTAERERRGRHSESHMKRKLRRLSFRNPAPSNHRKSSSRFGKKKFWPAFFWGATVGFYRRQFHLIGIYRTSNATWVLYSERWRHRLYIVMNGYMDKERRERGLLTCVDAWLQKIKIQWLDAYRKSLSEAKTSHTMKNISQKYRKRCLSHIQIPRGHSVLQCLQCWSYWEKCVGVLKK